MRFAFIWFEQYGARIARWFLLRLCSFLVFWVLGSVGVLEAVWGGMRGLETFWWCGEGAKNRIFLVFGEGSFVGGGGLEGWRGGVEG